MSPPSRSGETLTYITLVSLVAYAAIATDEDKFAEEIQKQQEQIMMPGIFQHVGKMAGIGSIEPPSFDQNDEASDDEEDEDFAQSRKQMKRRGSNQGSAKQVKNPVTMDSSDKHSHAKKEDEAGSDSDEDDDEEMFRGRMGYDDFMKKIEKH